MVAAGFKTAADNFRLRYAKVCFRILAAASFGGAAMR